MIGLSCTAIGSREQNTINDIYLNLKEPLKLNYLELAVGIHISAASLFEQPLVLHDKCLFEGNRRLDIFKKQDRSKYKSFCDLNNVLGISLHPPVYYIDDQSFTILINEIEQLLQIPVMVETMYNPNQLYSSFANIGNLKLLVDVSHVNIWSRGLNTEIDTLRLLNNYDVRSIHLSHNKGIKDTHDLVPEDVWFYKYLDKWVDSYLVTWESLPEEFRVYERLDKNKLRSTYNN